MSAYTNDNLHEIAKGFGTNLAALLEHYKIVDEEYLRFPGTTSRVLHGSRP
jgi:hypothetical protein